VLCGGKTATLIAEERENNGFKNLQMVIDVLQAGD